MFHKFYRRKFGVVLVNFIKNKKAVDFSTAFLFLNLFGIQNEFQILVIFLSI